MSDYEVIELTCIVCPSSCLLKVYRGREGEVVKVEGARCLRGVKYAEQEVRKPLRYVMTVVKVRDGEYPTASVITDRPVPKECIREIMEVTASIILEAPTEIGDVVAKDLCGGANLVITRRVKRKVTK